MWMVFKYQKFKLRVLLIIRLIFGQFHSGIAYKSIACKKACIYNMCAAYFQYQQLQQLGQLQ